MNMTMSPVAPSRTRREGPATAFVGADQASVVLAVLMITASLGGLLLDHLYRDNTWSRAAFRGTDLATLIIGVPTLLVALTLSRRGSLRARLIWLGVVAYNVYNYAFYLFGTAFNDFFLIYAALLSLSVGTVVAAAPKVVNAAGPITQSTPTRSVSAYMAVVGGLFGLLWMVQSVQFIATDELPAVVVDSGIHTSIVFALDLVLIVPAFILGALLLWRRQTTGFVLGTTLNVLGALYMVALAFGGGFQAAAGVPGTSWWAPPYIELAVTSLTAAWLLLRTVPRRDPRRFRS